MFILSMSSVVTTGIFLWERKIKDQARFLKIRLALTHENQPERGIKFVLRLDSVSGRTITTNQRIKYVLNLIHLARSINSLSANKFCQMVEQTVRKLVQETEESD